MEGTGQIPMSEHPDTFKKDLSQLLSIITAK
jgi:hypothetical protein